MVEVPLVVYDHGERKVLGTAKVSEKGEVTATFTDPAMQELLKPDTTDFSLWCRKEPFEVVEVTPIFAFRMGSIDMKEKE